MGRWVEEPRRVRAVPAVAAVGLALTAAPLTWWAIGPLGTQWPDHDVGPYHVPLGVEAAIGVIAIVVAVASVVSVLVCLRHPARHRLSVMTTVLLIAAGVIGAAGWRIATAGTVGANISGGLCLFGGPVLIAGLLWAAVTTETARRQERPRHVRALAALAVAVAPVLYATEFALSRYDQSVGVISAGEYASVQLGQTHDEVRARLGAPGDVVDWFFPAPPDGSSCDYYDTGGTSPTVYRICYRAGLVVRKQLSDHPQ